MEEKRVHDFGTINTLTYFFSLKQIIYKVLNILVRS